MENHGIGKELKVSGWYLSEEGLAHCAEQCKEKGWTVTTSNLKKVALDADLRLIGSGALSDDISRNLTSEVNGPIVLQIQKIKNTAVPSTKQHNPSPSKRLLRIQLTDGLVHVSAVELDGPVRNFSPTTPPGTKVKLVDKVAVQNGFLLLKKTSLEVLGGTVEALYKKWNSQKTGTDNQERSKGDTGSPKFIPFKASGPSSKASGEKSAVDAGIGQSKKQASVGVQAKSADGSRNQKLYESKSSSGTSRDAQKAQGRSKPTEERPRSDRAAVKTYQQEREKGDGRFSSKQPSKGIHDTAGSKSKERNEEKERHPARSSGYHQEKRSETSFRGNTASDRENWRNENNETSRYESGRRGRGRGRGRYQPDLEDYEPPSMGNRFQRKFDDTPGTGEPHDERGGGRRGRGRGRRGRRNGDDDTYQPSRPSAGHSLGDWFEQKLALNEKPSYMTKYKDDYYYGDLYFECEEPYAYYDGYSYEDGRHDDKPGAKKAGFTEPKEEYPPMPSKSSSRSTKQPMNQRGYNMYSEDKGRTTKEAWMEENYPSMPSRPAAKKPMSQPQPGHVQGKGEGHWDWVGQAAGSSAPSSARKRTMDY